MRIIIVVMGVGTPPGQEMGACHTLPLSHGDVVGDVSGEGAMKVRLPCHFFGGRRPMRNFEFALVVELVDPGDSELPDRFNECHEVVRWEKFSNPLVKSAKIRE